MLSVRDPIRRRQPIERPLDIVGLELLVTVSQTLLAGILLAVAAQLGGDARAYGLPIPGLLAVLAVAVGVGWLRWLVGGSGWLMASVSLATAILTGALWLLALQDESLPRVDPLVGLIAAACAIYGLVAGVFLDGPHRTHWKGGVSQPHRGVPQTRATPARFSPPVQKVVDERLSNVHLPQVSLPTARLTMPAVKLPTRAADPAPDAAAGDGLAPAAEVAPHAPTSAELAAVMMPSDPVADAVADAADAVDTPSAAASMTAELEATDLEATEIAGPAAAADVGPAGTDPVAEPMDPDPDAPTQPIAGPAPQWPRPIEPRGHTGAHKVDPGA